MDDRNNNSFPDVYFSYEYEDLTEEEIKAKVQNLMYARDNYLVSIGYYYDENGELVRPENRVLDGLIGFVVADALGVPGEASSRFYLSRNPIREMVGYRNHNVPYGTWSDDTSMMLATVDSILEKDVIDCEDLMKKFSMWVDYSDYTATGVVFDIGIGTKKAIENYKRGVEPLECGGKEFSDNGNGSLMRTLPLAYYLKAKKFSEEEEIKIISDVSSLTHAHEISILGCKIYSDFVKELLNGKDKFLALESIKMHEYNKYFSEDSISYYKRILDDDIASLSIDDINSSGYVVDSLEACLWCTLNSDSYEDAVVSAVNLGRDTDTIGALTGGINGILYGMEQIPIKWLSKLRRYDYLEDMCQQFSDKINIISRDNRLDSDGAELNDMFQEEPVIISSEVVDNGSHK